MPCEIRVKARGFKINLWSHLKGINWIRSNLPINSPLTDGSSTKHRSAETNDHPLTTFKAFPYIWQFFDENGANNESSPTLDEDFVGDEFNFSLKPIGFVLLFAAILYFALK